MPISHNDKLIKQLIEALGLPKNSVSFSLHVKLDSAVMVECEYYPDVKEEMVFERYTLARIDEDNG